MIVVNNVTKKYKNKEVNSNISFKLGEGKVLGILGPNGAGKSTLIRQMMGFTKSTNGKILFDELDPVKDHVKLMNSVGYIAGELNLFEHLTGKRYLELASIFKSDTDKRFLDDLINYFQIDITVRIKKMSKGMKQKIAIIAAVMNKPKYLILDEPTSGLDPVMQNRFINLIKKLNKENGTSIIICSHIFEEIISSSDFIIFIKDGKVVEAFNASEVSKVEELKLKFDAIYKDEVQI